MSVAAVFAVLAMAAMSAGRQPSAYRAPRLPDDHPDLNGIWQAVNAANYDLETHMARSALALREGPHGPLPAPAVLALGAVGAVPGGLSVVAGAQSRTNRRPFSRKRRTRKTG